MNLFKKISKAGAIGVPIALRRDLGLHPGDGMKLDVVEGEIRLVPQNPRCVFCGNNENDLPDTQFHWYKGRKVCDNCLGEIVKTAVGDTEGAAS